MSNQPTETPDDGPRQRQRGRVASQAPAEPAEPASDLPPPDGAGEEPEEPQVSRTLFSYLEPALDTIGSFGAPLVIAGVVGVVAGATLLAFVPAMRFYGYITIIIGVVLIGLIALISLSSVFAAFIGRTGRYGVNSLVMLGAFTGIVVVVNVVVFENNQRMDMTATNQFSLHSSTKRLLDGLDQPIQATAFFTTDFQRSEELIARRAKVQETFREFRAHTGQFSYRFVDPDLEPEVARNYGISQYETIVVEGQDSGLTDLIVPTDPGYSKLEQDMYTSILVVTGQEQKTVYFLTGHGERNINSSTGDGYASVRAGLERDNYLVKTLRWDPVNEQVEVPADAALLVIAGPTRDLPEAHAQALDRYLRGVNPDGTPRREAGRIIALVDTNSPASFRDFLARWGITAAPGYIRDMALSMPNQPTTLQARPYLPDPRLPLSGIPEITKPRGQPLGSAVMPGATALRVNDDGLRGLAPLALSSPDSYRIEDLERTEPITEGEQADPRGPFFPAVYVQAVRPVGERAPASRPPDNEIARLVVFGDSDFIANTFFQRPTSGPDLFLNSANYLLGDFSLVSIRPKVYPLRIFNLDQNEYNFVRFSSWFFLPGLLGLMAALVWWIRR